MVMMVNDISFDTSFYLGLSSHLANPPAIHLILSESEVLARNHSLYQGSGGVAASFIGITPSGANTKIYTLAENKLADVVNEICSVFGLTKEELAQLCKIQSRKTLYNWINGEAKPRRSAMNRVYDLLFVARAWHNSGLPADRDFLHQPVIDGESIFDLLSQTNINKEIILFAGSRKNMLAPSKDSILDPFA